MKTAFYTAASMPPMSTDGKLKRHKNVDSEEKSHMLMKDNLDIWLRICFLMNKTNNCQTYAKIWDAEKSMAQMNC